MFPSRVLPVHAVFVQQRLAALARQVDLRVCSPVPRFPLADRLVGRYRHRLDMPQHEQQGALEVDFPRFTSIPMVAKPLDGPAVLRCLRRHVRALREEGLDPVLLDAHLAFPEGWAAVRLGRELDRPVTVTLRGHDINVLAHTRGRRRMVQEALAGAARVFGVSRALCDGAVELGADPDRCVVSSNGVDLERFRPGDRHEARARLGLPTDRPTVVAVGHLVERKGFHHLLRAARALLDGPVPDMQLAILGAGGQEGDYSGELARLAAELELGDHLVMPGAVPNPQLRDWYVASDLSCLASEKEGWPNVVLESLACGRPVIATEVWGTPEILCEPGLGTLFPWADVAALTRALADGLARDWDAAAIRRYAEGHSWDDTARGLAREFAGVLGERGVALPPPAPGAP